VFSSQRNEKCGGDRWVYPDLTLHNASLGCIGLRLIGDGDQELEKRLDQKELT
jgi:hypothetical protein